MTTYDELLRQKKRLLAEQEVRIAIQKRDMERRRLQREVNAMQRPRTTKFISTSKNVIQKIIKKGIEGNRKK